MKLYSALSTDQLQTHQRFVAEIVFPLIYQETRGIAIIGSGCFYKSEKGIFLVAAKHVLRAVNIADIGIPIGPLCDGCRIRTLMQAKAHWFPDDNLDVAIVHLEDKLFIEEVAENWTILAQDNVDHTDPSENSEYLVAGYPYQNVELEQEKLIPKSLFQLYTSHFSGTSDKEPTRFDLLMRHTYKMTNAKSDVIEVVAMEGASGSPVWRLAEHVSGIWAPMKSLRLMGVQSSYKPNSYIKAKKWILVENLIGEM